MLLVGVVAAFQIGKVPAALPSIRVDLGLDMVGAGWVASLYTGTAVVLGLAGGVLADRIGHRTTLVMGLALLAAGSLGGSLAQSGAPIMVSRVVEGAGFVLIVVSAPTLIFRATAPHRHSFVMGVWGTFMPIGLTFMLLLAPVLMAAVGWRGLWQVNMAIAAAVAVFVLFSLRNGGRRAGPAVVPPPGRFWADLRETVARPGPWLMSLVFGVFGAQFSIFMTWLPTNLIDMHEISIPAAASLTALVAFVNVPGNLAAGWLMGRGVDRWLLLLVGAMSMGGFGVITYWPDLPLAANLSAAILFSMIGGLVPAAILASALFHAPSMSQVGTVNGILIHGANVGTLLGAPGFAAVVSYTGGWSGGALLFLAMGSASAILALIVGGLERRLARAAAPTE